MILNKIVELAVKYCGSKELASDWLYFPHADLDNMSPYTTIKYGRPKRVVELLERLNEENIHTN